MYIGNLRKPLKNGVITNEFNKVVFNIKLIVFLYACNQNEMKLMKQSHLQQHKNKMLINKFNKKITKFLFWKL